VKVNLPPAGIGCSFWGKQEKSGMVAEKLLGENGMAAEVANGKLTLAQKKRLKQKQRKQAKKAER